jgi:hypothetical protein
MATTASEGCVPRYQRRLARSADCASASKRQRHLAGHIAVL